MNTPVRDTQPTRKVVDRAFDAFQRTTVLLAEGNRPAAAEELRAAIRSLDGHPSAASLRGDLENVLATTTRYAS